MEIAAKQQGQEALIRSKELEDVLVPSRTKMSMAEIAGEMVAKRRALRTRLERTRKKMEEGREEEERRAKVRREAIFNMRRGMGLQQGIE